nr:aspartyl/asparaginyl beta-hydroxylase domain-containing protein [Reyranella soli]
MESPDKWLTTVEEENAAFRRKTGAIKLAVFRGIACLLALPRRLTKAMHGDGSAPSKHDYQLPWLPLLPALKATPMHDPRDHPWTQRLRQVEPEIKQELANAQKSFSQARYDSDLNPKRWTTYYFYLLGRPVREHLAACPRTAELLRQVPHNSFHVCFSAIEPGGPYILTLVRPMEAWWPTSDWRGARAHVCAWLATLQNTVTARFSFSTTASCIG